MNRINGKWLCLLVYGLVAVVMIVALPICQAARGGEPAGKDLENRALIRRLVEGLHNGVKEPKIKDMDAGPPYLIIPKTFDWESQKRICANIEKLVGMGTDAFSELIAHVDDHRFCGFWEFAEEEPVSVGRICEEIIERQVEPFHYDVHSPIISARVPHTLPKGRKRDWEAWWKRNQDKSLRELQINAAEASITILKHTRNDRTFPDESFDSWRARQIKGLTKMVEELKKSRKPKPARSGHFFRLLRQDRVKRVGDENRYYYDSR